MGEWSDYINEFRKGTKTDVYDVKGSFWYKIDTRRELEKANWLLSERACFPPPGHGKSVLMAIWGKPAIVLGRYLAQTRITANQLTLLGFICFLLVTFFFTLGEHVCFIIGSVILFYPCTILDWVDGLVARLKFVESKYGEWLDWMSSFMGWQMLLFGMTFGLHRQDPRSLVWVIGLLAMFGLFMSQCVASQSRIIFGFDRIGISEKLKTKQKANKSWRVLYKVQRILWERFVYYVFFSLILLGAILNQMFHVLLILCLWYNLWLPYFCVQLVLFRSYR